MKKLMKGFLVIFLIFTSTGCRCETDDGKNEIIIGIDDLVEQKPKIITVEFEDLYRHPKDYKGLELVIKGFISQIIGTGELIVIDSTFNREMKLNINESMKEETQKIMSNSRVNIHGTLNLDTDGVYSIDVIDIEHFTSLRSEQYWHGATMIIDVLDLIEIENSIGVDKDFEVLGTVVCASGYDGIFVDGIGFFIRIPDFQNNNNLKNHLVKLLFKIPTFDEYTDQYTAVVVEYEIID